MTNEDRKAKIAELRAEADRLERDGKRNWPEKVERGMLFQASTTATWMALGVDGRFVCVRGSKPNSSAIGASMIMDLDELARFDMTYLGHARDLLTIKTPDAPEPTGAELVGKVCDFSDDGVGWTMGTLWTGKRGGDPRICTGFSPDTELRYHNANCAWKYARLYREDRP